MILQNLKIQTQKNLSKQAIEYLKQREISKATALKWGIGFIPSEKIILELEGDKEILYKTGILLRKINKSPLNNYLTFPMYDQYNNIIGLSGRPPMSNEQVKIRGLKKYWHSIFDKKNFLFGLNFAIPKIRELGYVIVAEGQFDTITSSQNGIENIVSTCGTALTENQLILLSRYTDTVYVVFDNDVAGIEGSDRLSKFNFNEIKIITKFLPDTVDSDNNKIKEDPDSFIKKYGPAEFLKKIQDDNIK